MKKTRVVTVLVTLGASAFAPPNQQNQRAVTVSYPAFCSSPGGSLGLLDLEVFPNKGSPAHIALPFGLGRFAYSPDGKALYAERNNLRKANQHELYRIDLSPIRVTMIPVEVPLSRIHSIAVCPREDLLLVSGGYTEEGREQCGVFQINTRDGAFRPVLESPDCHYISAWLSLSLSPDGTQAVAVHDRSRHSLDLIDIARRKARSFGLGFLKASWSPDGRWIAALEDGTKSSGTVLFDARRLSQAKILSGSEVEWSLDSRYLLAVSSDGCSDESGTIQILDVQSGLRATVTTSECRVYQPTTGWVSSGVVR